MRIDAHCHTDCSDGSLSIEERIAMIKACQFDAATITDHDFISSQQILRAQAACGDLPFIPGIELSLRHEGQVVHLLGYYVDSEDDALQSYLKDVQMVDREQSIRLLNYFEKHGANFSIEEVESDSLHTFYSLMLIKRIARDIFQNDPHKCMPAFMGAMKSIGMTYATLAPWDVRNAIDLIHHAGGIAVLAHPGGMGDVVMRTLGFLLHTREHLQQYVEWGLDGVETNTPVHSVEEKQFYSNLAAKFHLFTTAGSDCHGDDPYLGPALMGKFVDIPSDSYESLRNYYQNGQF